MRLLPGAAMLFGALLGVAAPTLAGCESSGRSADRSPDLLSTERIVIIGDSLVVLAAGEIQTALEAVDEPARVTIVAESGRRIDEMTPRLQEALDGGAPATGIIVNLGTNDAIQGRGPARAVSDFDRLVDTTEDVPCVVLTTVSTLLDDRFANSVATELNVRIRELQADDPSRYQVVDWDAAVHAPGGVALLMAEDGVSDGVHENDGAGRQWFADEYRAALSRCPDPDRP